jgi:hypothetical protein
MTLGIIITFVILVLGLLCVGVSVSFLLKATEVKLGFIRPLSIATTYASIVGFVTGLAISLALADGGRAVNSAQFLGGISEALIPAIIGFSLLTIAWVAVSLGMRKHI